MKKENTPKKLKKRGPSALDKLCAKKAKKLRIFFLPFLCVYLELVPFIADKRPFKYLPITLLFAISFGFFLTAIGSLFSSKPARHYYKITSTILTLVYGIEFFANRILSTYYPASMLGTAAENHLDQFVGIIIQVVASLWYILILFLIPLIFIYKFAKPMFLLKRQPKHKVRRAIFCLVFAIVFHLLGSLIVHLPIWKGDLTPTKLYSMDTDYNDQVEQLGIYNMLRLDILHTTFPSTVKGSTSIDEDFTPTKPRDRQSEYDTSPNTMNIDFDALQKGTSNKDLQWLCKYFNSVEPTYKNKYTGIYKDYNVIFVTMEAFDYLAVDKDLTPTLYKLLNQGFVFNNFYSALHFTSTSNGECQNLLGLYPKNGFPISMKRTGELNTNLYFSLAQQLNRKGYVSYGYHNNYDLYGRAVSHSNLGYQWKYSSRGLSWEADKNGKLLWPQRDGLMVLNSIDDYLYGDKPFNIYYLTVTGHTPYSFNWATEKYKPMVDSLPYSENTKGYIATMLELDKFFELLLEKLEDAGKLDNTLIVAAPDHVPYSAVEAINEMAGKEFGTTEDLTNINERNIDFDVYRNGLIMWTNSQTQPVVVDKVCCQVDILPTISNLLGLDYDSRMMSGTDILSDSEGLVVFSSRSWKSDYGLYNRFTEKFTPIGEALNWTSDEIDSYVKDMKTIVSYKMECTAKIIENDFYNYVFGSDSKSDGSIGGNISSMPGNTIQYNDIGYVPVQQEHKGLYLKWNR